MSSLSQKVDLPFPLFDADNHQYAGAVHLASTPGCRHQAGEPAAHADHGPVVGPWRPFGPGRVRIVEVMRELAGEPEVLVVAVGPEALVPLFGVLAPQRFVVNGRHHIVPPCPA